MKSLTQWMLVALLLAVGPSAAARDLHGRLGLGYNNQWASEVAGVSLKYALSRDFVAQVTAAQNSTSPSRSALGLKLANNIFLETNLNFYFLGGAALVAAQNRSGVQLITGFGAEFFFPGLESLGFSFETGASLNNLSGSMSFSTYGISFLNAGIHFYF